MWLQQPAWITRCLSARTAGSRTSQKGLLDIILAPKAESSRNREPNGVLQTLVYEGIAD